MERSKIKNFLTPRRFLYTGGTILTVIGFLGIIGLFQRISQASLFNPPYWINFFHFGLGLIVLTGAFFGKHSLHVGITLVPAIFATTIGILGLFLGSWAAKKLNKPELADSSDHLAHLIVGLSAFWAWTNRKIDVSGI